MVHREFTRSEDKKQITIAPSGDVIFYVPVHSNLSQVEATLPFLTQYGGKLFLYDWNNADEKMRTFYKKNFPYLKLFTFNLTNIIQQLVDEQKPVVFLTTTSLTYSFGKAQLVLFKTLKKLFPGRVLDVLPIGHCLYGCSSCSHSTRIPLYFSRYFRGDLPYTAEDVRRKYIQNAGVMEKSILLCPSTDQWSMLTRPPVIEYLIELQKSNRYQFFVKFHPSIFPTEKENVFFDITRVEKQNVELMMKHMRIIDEEDFNILPFLEAFDKIIVDLESSVAFETLHFRSPEKVVFAHDNREKTYDPEYRQLFHLFYDVEDLKQIFAAM